MNQGGDGKGGERGEREGKKGRELKQVHPSVKGDGRRGDGGRQAGSESNGELLTSTRQREEYMLTPIEQYVVLMIDLTVTLHCI